MSNLTTAATALQKLLSRKKKEDFWDIYNDEAKKMDVELVKDWRDSLNFLLVFAAIFAAVLTAFIIESKKMLEPDPSTILVTLATLYIQNNGNMSNITLPLSTFQPSSVDISINCLLFASLGTSLFTALASVVALQWINSYDAAITRGGSSPEDYAKRRQFRYDGILYWKMGQIIAALPILIYISVMLFWGGIIQWIWSLHPVVGYVVAISTTIAVLWLTITTLLSAIFVAAPFRTAFSAGAYSVFHWQVVFCYKLLKKLPSPPPLSASWRSSVRQDLTEYPNFFMRLIYCLWIGLVDILSSCQRVAERIKKNILPSNTALRREALTVNRDLSLPQHALRWLAHQLPITADSHQRLLLMIRGIVTLLPEENVSPLFFDAPWGGITNLLGLHFARKIVHGPISDIDTDGVLTLLQFNSMKKISGKIYLSTEDVNMASLIQGIKTPQIPLQLDLLKTLLQISLQSPDDELAVAAHDSLRKLIVGAGPPSVVQDFLLESIKYIRTGPAMVQDALVRDAIFAAHAVTAVLDVIGPPGLMLPIPPVVMMIPGLMRLMRPNRSRLDISSMIPGFISGLETENSLTQELSILVLGELGKRDEFRVKILPVVPALVNLLSDSHYNVRYRVISSLAELKKYDEFHTAILALVPSFDDMKSRSQLLRGPEPRRMGGCHYLLP